MSTIELGGRAVFAWDARDAADVTLHALRRACDPNHLTDERLADYCEQSGKPSSRFERAVLREALGMISADDLAGRLARAMPRRARRDSLGVRIHGRVTERGGCVIARVRSASVERELVLRPGEPPPLTATSAVPGVLVVDATLRAADRTRPAVAAWQVTGGEPLGFVADATAPADALTALAGHVALSRLAEALAWRLRALLDRRCQPPLSALGRSPRPIRTYLLYWRRLRDFVVWRALHDA